MYKIPTDFIDWLKAVLVSSAHPPAAAEEAGMDSLLVSRPSWCIVSALIFNQRLGEEEFWQVTG